MRRIYAFEAEGVSDEVKAQLEKVEDVVDSKCDSAEDCDKILDKIDTQKEKFDDALKTMADAAKDCKDGKCDAGEMASKIAPKMAELKEVAKEIGVATESDAVTEEELKDVKEYLEGAEEIVEAKKDELDGGGKSDEDTEEDPATEAFMIGIFDDSMFALESVMYDAAMEGANMDAIGTVRGAMSKIRSLNKEMKKAKKAGNYSEAASKANECSSIADDAIKTVQNMDESVGSAVLANLAWTVAMCLALAAGGAAGSAVGTKIISSGVSAGRAAAAGAIGAAEGGAIGSGIGLLAGSAVVKFMKRKDAVDEDGKLDLKKAKLQPSDVNIIIASIKNDLRAVSGKYKKIAQKLSSKGGGESADEAASESFTGFIAACESMQFGDTGRSNRDLVPFLFD